MSADNDHMDENMIKELLNNISGEAHISPEIMLAYVDGKFSDNTNKKIQMHLKNCSECNDMYEMIQKSVKAEKEYDNTTKSVAESVEMPEKVSAKLELLSVLNKKKDYISEEIVKLFLPKDQWLMIKPAIRFISNNLDKIIFQEENAREIAAAAFTSYDESGKRPELKIIEQCLDFQNLVYEQLLEKATNVHECKDIMKDLIEASTPELEDLDISDSKKESILNVFVNTLKTGEV